MKRLETDKKNTFFVIQPHSFIDVITNSSTELFVLGKDKSVELVREILSEAISLHNKIHNTSYTFNEVFDEPYLGEPSKALNGFETYYHSNRNEGIIIRGAFDNSIPYWMFDFIQDAFGYDVERFHLG